MADVLPAGSPAAAARGEEGQRLSGGLFSNTVLLLVVWGDVRVLLGLLGLLFLST